MSFTGRSFAHSGWTRDNGSSVGIGFPVIVGSGGLLGRSHPISP
ncbi:hypothetical protein [Xylella taiwanensis]|uniref:Uncharacterized protein n=1 Tax=Xylella taiwanensis TaxID=1444770 RepID=Z9JJX3_9GAMM|nr:hypothetical protein [Xylella taiwanensis]EWS78126.1 hypothetical protein AF72_07200 [Xylella taiwanensis]